MTLSIKGKQPVKLQCLEACVFVHLTPLVISHCMYSRDTKGGNVILQDGTQFKDLCVYNTTPDKEGRPNRLKSKSQHGSQPRQ